MPSAPHPIVRLAESPTTPDEPDWEAEWIDLGGEG